MMGVLLAGVAHIRDRGDSSKFVEINNTIIPPDIEWPWLIGSNTKNQSVIIITITIVVFTSTCSCFSSNSSSSRSSSIIRASSVYINIVTINMFPGRIDLQ
jgi:hypothetical protein